MAKLNIQNFKQELLLHTNKVYSINIKQTKNLNTI